MASRSEVFILTLGGGGGVYVAPTVRLGVVLTLMVNISMFEVAGCGVSSIGTSL